VTGERVPRIELTAQDAGAGLGRLVVALLEVVRDLLERQAIRRMESGSLSDDETERLGTALMDLEARLAELREAFGGTAADLCPPIDVAGLLTPTPDSREPTAVPDQTGGRSCRP
jgi:hypothetical protein